VQQFSHLLNPLDELVKYDWINNEKK